MTNHIDEYVSSGTSPTAGARPSKKNQVVFLSVYHFPIDPERLFYEKSRRRCTNPLPAIRIGRYLRSDWVEVSAWLRKQSGKAA
jgi:hypothetical protein